MTASLAPTTSKPAAEAPDTEASRADFAIAVTSLQSFVKELFEIDEPPLERLEEIKDGVVIKNDTGTVVFANQAFLHRLPAGPRLVGRRARGVLSPAVANIAEQTDSLVLSGCETIEFEYSQFSNQGRLFRVRALKQDLRPLRRPGYAILGMMRVLREEHDITAHVNANLEVACVAYHNLEPRDQEICRLTVLGHSYDVIGEQLGMTGRNVEVRRKKAFNSLGVNKPLELARLLVRLQERGYLDLGL